jgi:hypothetical protein
MKFMYTLCSYVHFSLNPRYSRCFQLYFKYVAFSFMLFILLNPPAALNGK